jgi:hypothetical protein
MLKFNKLHLLIFLWGVFIPSFLLAYNEKQITEQCGSILIQKNQVQGTPKDSSIQASINGHYLTVVFTENIGQVTVEVSKVSGGETQVESTPTPNGVNFYIYDTGSYIVTFHLSNGDEYYGEFEVSD